MGINEHFLGVPVFYLSPNKHKKQRKTATALTITKIMERTGYGFQTCHITLFKKFYITMKNMRHARK